MSNDWLKEQLTGTKKDSPMWIGLANAVQQIFDEQVRPLTDRIAALNSYFTMHKDDLKKRVDELGSFFYVASNVEQEDVPLALMQKLDEVHFKRTDLPIKNTISREFEGLQIAWASLYAPRVITPEGSNDYTKKAYQGGLVNALRTKSEIDDSREDINDYFLTSRGVIQITSTQLAESGHTSEEFSALVNRVLSPLIPTDIVFDGEHLLVHYDILEPIERLFFYEQTVTEIFNTIYESARLTQTGSTSDAYRLNNNLDPIEGYANRIDAISLDFWPLDRLS